jgi:hypothetical protein
MPAGFCFHRIRATAELTASVSAMLATPMPIQRITGWGIQDWICPTTCQPEMLPHSLYRPRCGIVADMAIFDEEIDQWTWSIIGLWVVVVCAINMIASYLKRYIPSEARRC